MIRFPFVFFVCFVVENSSGVSCFGILQRENYARFQIGSWLDSAADANQRVIVIFCRV
jgi:hypothetical protein